MLNVEEVKARVQNDPESYLRQRIRTLSWSSRGAEESDLLAEKLEAAHDLGDEELTDAGLLRLAMEELEKELERLRSLEQDQDLMEVRRWAWEQYEQAKQMMDNEASEPSESEDRPLIADVRRAPNPFSDEVGLDICWCFDMRVATEKIIADFDPFVIYQKDPFKPRGFVDEDLEDLMEDAEPWKLPASFGFADSVSHSIEVGLMQGVSALGMFKAIVEQGRFVMRLPILEVLSLYPRDVSMRDEDGEHEIIFPLNWKGMELCATSVLDDSWGKKISSDDEECTRSLDFYRESQDVDTQIYSDPKMMDILFGFRDYKRGRKRDPQENGLSGFFLQDPGLIDGIWGAYMDWKESQEGKSAK